jgi:hypothetical protein
LQCLRLNNIFAQRRLEQLWRAAGAAIHLLEVIEARSLILSNETLISEFSTVKTPFPSSLVHFAVPDPAFHSDEPFLFICLTGRHIHR